MGIYFKCSKCGLPTLDWQGETAISYDESKKDYAYACPRCGAIIGSDNFIHSHKEFIQEEDEYYKDKEE